MVEEASKKTEVPAEEAVMAPPAIAGKARKPKVTISLLACILLPGLVASLYFFVFAANQYVSQASFAVRSNDTQTADVLGMMTGMPGATITSDSYIVTDYIRSREMVEELERRLSLRK